MSKADELLESLTENQTDTRAMEDSNEPHIVITADRDIVVPDILKEIAVQHEHNVKTVTFDCPRYWDGRDLLEMVIYVNYERKDGEKGRCPVKNVHVDEADSNMIHFDWTITRHVTEVFGELTILACGVLVDSEGVEEQHWNSHRHEDMEVAEGLECGDAIAEAYPDEITVILAKIQSLENHTHTAKEVGAIPEGGDPEGDVRFQSLYVTDILAGVELTLLDVENPLNNISIYNQVERDEDHTLIAQFWTNDGKAVRVRNIAYPGSDYDAANAAYVLEQKRFVLGLISDLEKYVAENMPKKVSDLDNDAGYMTGEAFAESMKGYYTSQVIDQKLQNLDKYATTQYVDDTVGAINAILATLSNGGVSGGES